MDVGITRFRQVTGVVACALCLVWASFFLRFHVRIAILKFLGNEDWLTIAAMAVFTVFCSLCLRATHFGLGAHMEHIPRTALVAGFKIAFVCELLYVASSTVTKASVAAYFVRLSSKKYQKTIIYLNIIAVIIFSTTYFFLLIFQCSPVDHVWLQFMEHPQNGKCLGSTIAGITYAHSAMSVITDWVFGVLPISFVWNMKMNPRTKFSVILILSLGFFASTATIVRIAYIKRLTKTTDYSWEGINLTKWSIVEPAIAITAMNIATLRPMFSKFLSFRSKSMSHALDDDDTLLYHPANRVLQGNNVNKEISEEFSALLGLSRTGVKTEISVGDSKKRFVLRKSKANRPEGTRALQKELTGVCATQCSIPRIESKAPTQGIEVTTVITVRHDP